MTQKYSNADSDNMNIGINDVHDKMSNFEVQAARKQGVSFDVFQEKCSWSSNEIKERIIAARNGAEWQRGEGPNAIKEAKEREARRFEAIKDEYSEIRSELLKAIHDGIVDVYYEYRDDEYREWWGSLKGKHDHTVSYFKGIMDKNNISYNDTDKSGIDFVLPDGEECVIHGLGGDLGGFVIHDVIDNLKGDIFIYINNMAQRNHIVSIMSRNVVLSNCSDRGNDPQTMMPLKVIKEYIDNYGILK